MGKYFDELQKAMEFLAQDDRTHFLGQAVCYAGTGMTNSFKNIPAHKKTEMPVCEDFQQGIANGTLIQNSDGTVSKANSNGQVATHGGQY